MRAQSKYTRGSEVIVKPTIEACHATMDAIRLSLAVMDRGVEFTEEYDAINRIMVGEITAIVYGNLTETHQEEINLYNDCETPKRTVLFSVSPYIKITRY